MNLAEGEVFFGLIFANDDETTALGELRIVSNFDFLNPCANFIDCPLVALFQDIQN